MRNHRLRLGALGLGLSAVLLTAFPLARPFFRMDIFAPEETIMAASPAFASVAWVFAHYLAMLGFLLLLGGMLALYAIHAGTEAEPRAFLGLVWGIMSVALVMPALGVEIFTMPVIGRLYLAGATGLAPAIPLTYAGPMTVVLILGLVFLAVGAINFAFAIRRSRHSGLGRLHLRHRPRPLAATLAEARAHHRWLLDRPRRCDARVGSVAARLTSLRARR